MFNKLDRTESWLPEFCVMLYTAVQNAYAGPREEKYKKVKRDDQNMNRATDHTQ